MLPTTQEYKIALMIGEDSFRTLQNLEVIPHPTYPNEPWYSTGGLAIVFKIKLKDKYYALKCFYAEANERQERLGHIATYLLQNHSPYFVDFTYLDNELWVETAHGGGGYPVVLMEWIEGKTLDNYLAEICLQPHYHALQNLYFQFCNLAWWLQQQPIAHGDLKHDNIIVTNEGKLKLIDYDGMFVPALQGRKANEQGSPCYQHPQRDAYYFNEHLDDFSLLILQITLLALKQDPSLFKAHYNGDGILLKDTDYPNFAKSSIKAHLWRLDDVKTPLLLSQLQSNLHKLSSIDLMPLLQDVEWVNWLVDGQKDSKLVIEKQRLKELILKDSDWSSVQGSKWKDLLITQLLLYYPLSESLLEKYKERWYWDYLSRNTGLPWTMELIEKYKDKLNWDYLSRNTGLPWTMELIEKYKDKLNWDYLSRNTGLPWTMELIEEYEGRWNWNYLNNNTSLPWTMKLIEKYEDRWNWNYLSRNTSLPWTMKLIEKYEDRWNGALLSFNTALPWTIELIEEYVNRWEWDELVRNEGLLWTMELIEKYKDRWNWGYLSKNKDLPWTIELIEKYTDKWVWDYLSSSTGLPWTIELIEKYIDRWEWYSLSINNGLPWTTELIEKYIDRWEWNSLSKNTGLPWTVELIEKYKERWYWDYLSRNTGLPWTIELIEKYKDKWNWDYLSRNTGLPWTVELIEKYLNRLEQHRYSLTRNKGLNWTMELIEKFKGRWDWSYLNVDEGIYKKVFKPLLDDIFVDEIMSSLSPLILQNENNQILWFEKIFQKW